MTSALPPRVVVIGGGPAGFFAAIHCAEQHPEATVTLLEGGPSVLAKVKISGGGRCNVTHACSNPQELVKAYPRGARELLGPFTRFGCEHTVRWFEEHGVAIKAENDGRMFPASDSSQTIIDCLARAAVQAGVTIRTSCRVKNVLREYERFHLTLSDGETLECDRLILATGSAQTGHHIARSLGHTITPLAPSLFSFQIEDSRLADLSGLSFPDVSLALRIEHCDDFLQSGPILITHWGLSGPAILKLSAWAAKELAVAKYHATLRVNWIGQTTLDKCFAALLAIREQYPQRILSTNPEFSLPKRFWTRIALCAPISKELRYFNASNLVLRNLAELLTRSELQVKAKGEFKDEFVTCGGVQLSEINFRTMESKRVAGLFFAGEILDVDALTGGYNFQNAWTTGWLAGQSVLALRG